MNSFRSNRRLLLAICASLALLSLPALSRADSYDDWFRAVQIDDDQTVAGLLKRGFDPNTIERDRGDSGLMIAVRENAMRVFKVLLNARDIDLDQKATNGDTPLMLAAFKANKPAVEALLQKGATVNRPGWTPLHYAAAAGDNDIVQMLLDKSADLDARSPNGTTPIMMAARGSHILTVKLLLDAGADATLKNQQGMTAIDFARQAGDTQIVEGLTYRLKKAGKL
ncbi:MAG TPA: ankyrin repeat domain-containing protein [Oxalicibacterium sp.]|jgi:ankyrin repeat protein|nr:ankyrin repeat domain-containing protein [Oxalicibacterium sp.]